VPGGTFTGSGTSACALAPNASSATKIPVPKLGLEREKAGTGAVYEMPAARAPAIWQTPPG
jgi:hypothetical protein